MRVQDVLTKDAPTETKRAAGPTAIEEGAGAAAPPQPAAPSRERVDEQPDQNEGQKEPRTLAPSPFVWLARQAYGRGGRPLSQALARCGHVCEACVLVLFTLALLLGTVSFFAKEPDVTAGAWVLFAVCVLLMLATLAASIRFAADSLAAAELEEDEVRFVISEWRLAGLNADGLDRAVLSYLAQKLEKSRQERLVIFGERQFFRDLEDNFGRARVADTRGLIVKHLGG